MKNFHGSMLALLILPIIDYRAAINNLLEKVRIYEIHKFSDTKG